MMKWLVRILVVVLLAGLVVSFLVTRDGSRVVSEGEGSIATASGRFEAFQLPDYAAGVA